MNPTTDERLSWECDNSCMPDSNEEVERSQNRVHEVTTLNCNMMIRSLQRETTEVRTLPASDDATNGAEFINHWGTTVMEQKRPDTQEEVLRATTTQGWRAPRKIKWNRCDHRRQPFVQVGGSQRRTRSGQPGRSGLGTYLRRRMHPYDAQPPPQLNLHVLRVRWAFRTINKLRHAKMTPSALRSDETRKAERISPRIAPAVWTNLGKGI